MTKNNTPPIKISTSIVKKKQIPKKIKQLVWNKYIGMKYGTSTCFCCRTTEISQMDFHCGHVISEKNGGDITVGNLRPICALCNSSMSVTNMVDFINKHKLHQTSVYRYIINKLKQIYNISTNIFYTNTK